MSHRAYEFSARRKDRDANRMRYSAARVIACGLIVAVAIW
jgi:hypothetical protein